MINTEGRCYSSQPPVATANAALAVPGAIGRHAFWAVSSISASAAAPHTMYRGTFVQRPLPKSTASPRTKSARDGLTAFYVTASF